MGMPQSTSSSRVQSSQHRHRATEAARAGPAPTRTRPWTDSANASARVGHVLNVHAAECPARRWALAEAHAIGRTRAARGLTQVSPVPYRKPTPPQFLQVRPSTGSGMGIPHATSLAEAQDGQQAHRGTSSRSGSACRSPDTPHPPRACQRNAFPTGDHVGGRASRGADALAVDALRPSAQGPSQRPSQPSGAPLMASAGQDGTHSQSPVSGLHTSCGLGLLAHLGSTCGPVCGLRSG
jgi:hypothetical protein